MTDPIPPFSDLDGVLRQARHLLIDFDGPICDLWAGHPAALAADQLRKLLTDQDIQLPDTIAATPAPLAVLFYAATISPGLAATAEADLTGLELSAVPTAQLTGYADDVITSARESGRTATVISSSSERAVNAYLARNSLDGEVGLVVARTTHEPHPVASLIEHATTALQASPAACMLVASSPASIDAATAGGTRTIGHARTPNDREHLSHTQASAVISSLADLVLRLRARPLPN